MALELEALFPSNDLLDYFINVPTSLPNTSPEQCVKPPEHGGAWRPVSDLRQPKVAPYLGKKKRRRRPSRVSKNKYGAETQRMTHIVVERNRRRQMNEHLAVLRSLMPESYVQRLRCHHVIGPEKIIVVTLTNHMLTPQRGGNASYGDQASIIGGAIECVKQLENLLQSLESQKLQMLQQSEPIDNDMEPFAQFFVHPQFSRSQNPNNIATTSEEAIADIEVTLIETHANIRVLSRKCVRQLSKMVYGFQLLCLTILHLDVTTLDPLVLYSVSVKVEEGCQLTSVDDIAGAVHHMLRVIEDEVLLG